MHPYHSHLHIHNLINCYAILSIIILYGRNLVLCAPIKSPKGEILGAIQAVNKVDELFGRADEELIQTLAAQVNELRLLYCQYGQFDMLYNCHHNSFCMLLLLLM